MNYGDKEFRTRKELFDWMVANKQTLTAQKKAVMKQADGISVINQVSKNETTDTTDRDEINVKVVINTTNVMDSHKDVHIPGLWTKTLQENKTIMLIQEHNLREFKYIIANWKDVRPYTQSFTWQQLGYDLPGETEALVFDATIRRDKNPEMFERYAKGDVFNHSVGMYYVKLIMCINDESYGAENEAWEKYFPMIANKEEAERLGYFWAVTEAKCIEGSAVPLGSNTFTPTLEVKGIEPGNHSTDIQVSRQKSALIERIENFTF